MSLQTEDLVAISTDDKNLKRSQLVQLMRRFGGLASDALLDPSCDYYRKDGIEGFIGYRLKNRTAVVFGDPVCSKEDIAELTAGFHLHCQKMQWKVIYISASEEFAKWAIEHRCKVLLQFGSEFYMDPHNDPRSRTGTHASLVRRKVRHAQHEGVAVSEYTGEDPLLESHIELVGEEWLKMRKGPQIHISNVRLFSDRPGKRWFYAKAGDKIVGAAVLNRLEKSNGWLLNHIVFTPDAPNGTPEFLVTTALEAAAKSGSHYVTFGNSPSAHIGQAIGLSSFSASLTRIAYQIISKYFRLDGHKMFWDKFDPESHNSYLLFGEGRIGLREIMALKNALNVSM